MTQLIEYSSIPTHMVLAPSSRYMKQSIIYYGEQRFLTMETYIRKPYTPTGSEQVMVISKAEEYRPDLVSYDFYGFSENWYKIMEANKIYDIFDFKAGKTIILPIS